jgi:hypothetical protein
MQLEASQHRSLHAHLLLHLLSCMCGWPVAYRLTPCLRASYDTAMMLPLLSGKSLSSEGLTVRRSPYCTSGRPQRTQQL